MASMLRSTVKPALPPSWLPVATRAPCRMLDAADGPSCGGQDAGCWLAEGPGGRCMELEADSRRGVEREEEGARSWLRTARLSS